jgi:hypothetical protein
MGLSCPGAHTSKCIIYMSSIYDNDEKSKSLVVLDIVNVKTDKAF